jgi:AAA15 family ATPase/GTPase
MLNLQFIQPHNSIKAFEDCELPDFSIITGVNGSGKTHLLEAIQHGHIKIQEFNKNQVKLYNTANFQASIEEASTPASAYKARDAISKKYIQLRDREIERVRKQLAGWNIELPSENSIEDLFDTTTGKLDLILKETKLNGNAPATQYLSNIQKILNDSCTRLRQQLGTDSIILDSIIESQLLNIMKLRELDFRNSITTLVADNTFQLKLASQFSAWLAAFEYNRINRFYATQEGKEYVYLDDEAFYKMHGYEPWITANEILDQANLPYTFNHPTGTIYDINGAYQLRLKDKTSGDEISIGQLSSGEKGLLALISLRYQASIENGLKTLPKVLLLDEIDAHLHPSFTKVVLHTLKEVFVDQGIKVILATHSPSTVALAEQYEATIFELTRIDKKLRKIDSSTASSILTSGFLSVFPDDQIVICEAIDDANYYQNIHDRLVQKEFIPCYPALRFIPASNKANSGEGGGCAQAKQWADKLSELNLSKFRGLIDWDPKKDANNESENIRVIKRSALENYLLDPLTLLAILIDNGASDLFPMWENTDQTSSNLFKTPPEIIESMITKLEELIELPNTEKTTIDYISGLEVSVSEEWIKERGHDLQQKIGAKFNLVPIINQTGKIISEDGRSKKYTDYQTNKHISLIPNCLVETLKDLKVAN